MTMLQGRYLLEHEIGRGATGVVWAATDMQLGRRVALKMLHAECVGDTDACARFEREARTIAQLRSPYIVQIFDYGVTDCQPYIVMELLDGEDLESRLRRNPRWTLSGVAGLVANVSKGLRAIHQAGIVHRDLKPANIYLTREVRGEVPKLLDFSVAASLPQPPPSGGLAPLLTSLAGTPLYMSPEHFWGGPLEPASDLWSLAVICYEMLTGEQPFQGLSFGQLQERICDSSHRPPSEIDRQLGFEVDAFFERALAKRAADRFGDANEFATALLELADRPAASVVRVLYLDDELDMELLLRQKFRQKLREGRYELYFACNGEAGLRELRSRPDIDVVMTDINMPGMDGLAFLARVPEVNPLVPVVVVSAYSDMANIRAAMNRGAYDFLCKPIDFEDLERTIEKTAGQSSMLREALRSREENATLKLFAGQAGSAMLRSVQVFERVHPEATESTVVVAMLEVQSAKAVPAAFETLNEHLNRLAPEFISSGGQVLRFGDHTLWLAYQGDRHQSRAIDACMAALQSLERGVPRRAVRLACGIASGTLLSGALGSAALGRMDQVAMGEPVDRALQLALRAVPGSILTTLELAERLKDSYSFIQSEDSGPPALAEPAWRVVSSLGEQERAAPGNGPLIGRAS